jgi:hypothetical protein
VGKQLGIATSTRRSPKKDKKSKKHHKKPGK